MSFLLTTQTQCACQSQSGIQMSTLSCMPYALRQSYSVVGCGDFFFAHTLGMPRL